MSSNIQGILESTGGLHQQVSAAASIHFPAALPVASCLGKVVFWLDSSTKAKLRFHKLFCPELSRSLAISQAHWPTQKLARNFSTCCLEKLFLLRLKDLVCVVYYIDGIFVNIYGKIMCLCGTTECYM